MKFFLNETNSSGGSVCADFVVRQKREKTFKNEVLADILRTYQNLSRDSGQSCRELIDAIMGLL